MLISIAGCSEEDPSMNASLLRFKITESSTLPVTSANLDVQSIEVHITDSVGEAKWMPVEYGGGTYNLVNLANGKSQQISDRFFPTGVIDQVKIVFGDHVTIKDKNAVLSSKDTLTMPVPTEYKDGITVNTHIVHTPHIIGNVMIDVNLLQSIYKRGDEYFFIPFVRIYDEAYNGKIKGMISPVEASPYIKIGLEQDTIITLPNGDGTFSFSGLNPGIWKIHIFPIAVGYRDTLFTDTVLINKVTEIKPRPIVLKKTS